MRPSRATQRGLPPDWRARGWRRGAPPAKWACWSESIECPREGCAMSYGLRLAAVLICALAVLQVAPARAERKVALLIGNSLYGHQAALPNVPNDAAAMATLLKGAGFDRVDVRSNLGLAAVRGALRDFAAEVA